MIGLLVIAGVLVWAGATLMIDYWVRMVFHLGEIHIRPTTTVIRVEGLRLCRPSRPSPYGRGKGRDG
jgi:hypothetical protein